MKLGQHDEENAALKVGYLKNAIFIEDSIS